MTPSLADAANALAEVLEAPPPPNVVCHPDDPVGTIDVGGYAFAVVTRSSSSGRALFSALEQARAYAASVRPDAIPLVVVPHMGATGDKGCVDAGVSWLDLSGNARIKAPGLRIWLAGHPNRFKALGRPASVFAPKSARVARWLLSHPGEALFQRELAQATGLDEGFTSRIVARLVAEDLVQRDEHGYIRVRERGRLLDAWNEDYDFSKHTVIKGHVYARSGPELANRLATYFFEKQPCKMTGLAAAWQMTRFASFRLATAYLATLPTRADLDALDFREEARGANTWLIVPNDPGVFEGGKSWDGISCVHPVQAYVDLKAMPERAREAAVSLREMILEAPADAR